MTQDIAVPEPRSREEVLDSLAESVGRARMAASQIGSFADGVTADLIVTATEMADEEENDDEDDLS